MGSSQSQTNASRHGINFERAATVFLDREALSKYDEEYSNREDRWITLGMDRTGIPLVVCHTYREETAGLARIRIISARKATRNETKPYGSQ